MMNQQDSNY